MQYFGGYSLGFNFTSRASIKPKKPSPIPVLKKIIIALLSTTYFLILSS
jgi:hypothetical protein